MADRETDRRTGRQTRLRWFTYSAHSLLNIETLQKGLLTTESKSPMMAENTRFLRITHNRPTCSAAAPAASIGLFFDLRRCLPALLDQQRGTRGPAGQAGALFHSRP